MITRLRYRNRTSHAWWVATLAASTLGIAVPAWSQRSTDTVHLFDGNPIRGKIVRTSPDGIELDTPAGPRTVAAEDIKQILLGDEPMALRSAREAILDGRLEQAIQGLDRIKTDQLEEGLIRQDYAFYRAYAQGRLALEQGSGASEAVRPLRAFASDNRDSWHIYQTAELLGDLAVKLGRFDHARTFYGQLGNSQSAVTRMRGALLEAESLRRQGPDHYPGAIERYDAVLAVDASSSAAERYKHLATIGNARCRVDTDDLQESIDVLEGIIAQNDASDTELFARAYVALGACHLRMENLEDAVLALLKVDLLFMDDPDAHAEALYHLSKLWSQLGKPDRAADAQERLQSRYGGSTWARQP